MSQWVNIGLGLEASYDGTHFLQVRATKEPHRMVLMDETHLEKALAFIREARKGQREYTVYANGREKKIVVDGGVLMYEDVVRMCLDKDGRPRDWDKILKHVWTVMWSDRHSHAAGTLIQGQSVHVLDGMHFECADTSNA